MLDSIVAVLPHADALPQDAIGIEDLLRLHVPDLVLVHLIDERVEIIAVTVDRLHLLHAKRRKEGETATLLRRSAAIFFFKKNIIHMPFFILIFFLLPAPLMMQSVAKCPVP